MKVLILQHEAATPPGHLEEWLELQRAGVDLFRIDQRPDLPEPQDYDLIVSLGSELAAFDDSAPFVPREAAILRASFDRGIAMLGLCFGGQLLARALGGSARRNENLEIGWTLIHTVDPDLAPKGPWFEWHYDRFALPAAARLLAQTGAGPQAFVIGRSLGLQFHPEVTPEIVEAWVGLSRGELDAQGVEADQLVEETRRHASASRLMALRLFDCFADRVAGVQNSHPNPSSL